MILLYTLKFFFKIWSEDISAKIDFRMKYFYANNENVRKVKRSKLLKIRRICSHI